MSLLKAWKVGIECDNATFECHFKKVHTRNNSFKKKILNSASKVLNWIIVDMLKYLYKRYVITDKVLATHFFIRSGDCQRSLSLAAIYLLSFNLTVAYHSN